MLTATKIRIYPNITQADKLAKAFGRARWYWNNSLAETPKVYMETGKGLGQYQLNARLPKLKMNLARKQQYLSRKVEGSNTRNKARLLVAKAHERVANARKDYCHKLSTRLMNENQVIAVKDLHVKGMMKSHNLARAIGNASWSAFTNMLKYKAARAGKGYIEVNRFFASSKTCSCCLHAQAQMPLTIRMWSCDQCGVRHDRDVNAAINIRNEAQRMITAGMVVTANGGTVSRGVGRKSSIALVPLKLEAPSFTAG